MAKVSKDARSRFQAGPIATLELPDTRLRHDILEADLKRRGLQLPPSKIKVARVKPRVPAKEGRAPKAEERETNESE